MRSVIIAALTALAAAATISIACAQNDQSISSPPQPAPAVNDKPPSITAEKEPGITVKQESAVPYRPCREAQGWVNGRLRCDNRY